MTDQNIPVHMFRADLQALPDIPFPDGFTMRLLRAGEETLWEDIQRDAETLLKIEPGLFTQEFGADLPAAYCRCFLVTGPRNRAVGAISAWYTRDYYGCNAGRIHWLAIRPAFQGRGLARAALARTLTILSQWHRQAWLSTSTARVTAIRLYLEAGFHPDLRPDGALASWRLYRERNPHPALMTLD